MKVSDSALIAQVRNTLLKDVRTAAQMIDVIASEGVILLFGTCDEDYQARVAITLTKGIVGVVEVIDKITRHNLTLEKVA